MFYTLYPVLYNFTTLFKYKGIIYYTLFLYSSFSVSTTTDISAPADNSLLIWLPKVHSAVDS